MNQKTLIAAAAVALLVSSNIASAIPYTDNNPADVRLDANYLSGLNPLYNPSYSGQFDLTGYGYNPISQKIDSAKVVFTLWDLPLIGGDEAYTITIEGNSLFAGGSFSGFITPNAVISGTLLANLDVDGILNYTVTASTGSFWLKNANLTAEASPRDSGIPSIPDGGTTSVMLGLGLLGLAGLRTRLSIR